MAGKQIKQYTFTNKFDKTLLIKGITANDITLVPGTEVSVSVTDLIPGWSEVLKSWGRYIAIGTSFKDLVNPFFGVSPDLSKEKFTLGSEVAFKVKVTSKDYIGTYARLKFKMGTMTEGYSIKVLDPVKQQFIDVTTGDFLFKMANKTNTFQAQLTIGTMFDTEAVTDKLTVSMLKQDGTQYSSTDFNFTATPAENKVITSFMKNDANKQTFEVGTATVVTFNVDSGNQTDEMVQGKVSFTDKSAVSKIEFESDGSYSDVADGVFGGDSGFELADGDLKLRVTFANTNQTKMTVDLVRVSDGVQLAQTVDLITPVPKAETEEDAEP